MDIAKEIITNLITSSVILGLSLFIIKKYFDKLISAEFDKRIKLTNSRIEQVAKMSDFFLEKEVGIYPEILEITYRLKNIIRDGIKESHAYKWSPELRPLCVHLTENLFKYRLFISEEIFNALHKFKQISQDALIFYDMQTRDENLFNEKEYQGKVKEFEGEYRELEELYNLIIKGIRHKFNSIAKFKP